MIAILNRERLLNIHYSSRESGRYLGAWWNVEMVIHHVIGGNNFYTYSIKITYENFQGNTRQLYRSWSGLKDKGRDVAEFLIITEYDSDFKSRKIT